MNQMAQSQVKAQTSKASSWMLKVIFGLLLLVVVSIAGLWVWSGTNSSLSTALSIVQGRLGDGRSLVATGIKGSIREGGDFETLHWEQKGLRVELTDVQVRWQLMPLLSGKLVIEEMKVGRVQVVPKKSVQSAVLESGDALQDDMSQSSGQEMAGPPKEIMLPIELDLQKFEIGSVYVGDRVDGQANIQADTEVMSGLSGSYVFDKLHHVLTIDKAHMADGDYQGQVKLTAVEPILDADIQGVLETQVPESEKEVKLNVMTKLQGPLDRFGVDMLAQDVEGDADALPSASLKAIVMPWAGGMILPQADLRLQSFNLNAFWTKAPVTLLSGSADVVPLTNVTASAASGAAFDVQSLGLILNMSNALPGRKSENRLPFETVNGHFVGQSHTIGIDHVGVSTGEGHIDVTGVITMAQGRRMPKVTGWDMSAKLNQIDPYLFTDALASDAVSGTVKAHQKKAGVIAFDIALTSAQAANVPHFKVKQVNAQGSFENKNLIRLNTFSVQSSDAEVSGSEVTYSLAFKAVSGPVKLVAPGLEARATFNEFARDAGSAKVSMDLESAELASNWIKRQPKIKAAQLLLLLDRLKGVTDRVDNVVALTGEIPLSVTGGWGQPTIKAEADAKSLVKAIMEAKAKEKLLPALDKLEESGKISEKEKQLLTGAGGKLGEFLKKKK